MGRTCEGSGRLGGLLPETAGKPRGPGRSLRARLLRRRRRRLRLGPEGMAGHCRKQEGFPQRRRQGGHGFPLLPPGASPRKRWRLSPAAPPRPVLGRNLSEELAPCLPPRWPGRLDTNRHPPMEDDRPSPRRSAESIPPRLSLPRILENTDTPSPTLPSTRQMSLTKSHFKAIPWFIMTTVTTVVISSVVKTCLPGQKVN